MTKRKMVNKEVATINIDGYLLKDVIKDLTALLVEHGDGAMVREETYTYEDGKYLALLVPTLETDEEMAFRLREEAFYASVREDRERKEFERLRAKFGAKK